jgi:hypothetical protein
MYICYLDESGTPQIGANTSHFVLLGLVIPDIKWKEYDRQILERKAAFQLSGVEIHTAWLLRDYPEQKRISEFGRLGYEDRKKAILSIRALNLARSRTHSQQRELLKNYKHTSEYAHLTIEERKAFLNSIADTINSWKDAVLFAEAQDKAKAQPVNAFDVAFEQVVTRFNTFLGARGQAMGMIVQDNNQTVSSLLTASMRRYHREGTIWSKIDRIIETPLFVDSHLTSMVQVADLCAVAVRRFCEKGDRELFDRIKSRFDRSGDRLVGIRHYTGRVKCSCEICKEHGRVW